MIVVGAGSQARLSHRVSLNFDLGRVGTCLAANVSSNSGGSRGQSLAPAAYQCRVMKSEIPRVTPYPFHHSNIRYGIRNIDYFSHYSVESSSSSEVV